MYYVCNIGALDCLIKKSLNLTLKHVQVLNCLELRLNNITNLPLTINLNENTRTIEY